MDGTLRETDGGFVQDHGCRRDTGSFLLMSEHLMLGWKLPGRVSSHDPVTAVGEVSREVSLRFPANIHDPYSYLG